MTKDGAGDRTAAAAQDAMMHEIARDVRLVADRLGKDEFDPAVMAVLGRVPREAFVPEGRRAAAYVNAPLPIGHGQTISQPFIVAAMKDMLALRAESRVLEIGTGCGYQTAVLAEIAARVYTIEFVAELGESAARRLDSLGYTNIACRTGDGRAGWPEHAPYDARRLQTMCIGSQHVLPGCPRNLTEREDGRNEAGAYMAFAGRIAIIEI